MDDRNYNAVLRGRVDVTSRTNLGLELGKSHTQGGPNTINLTDIVGEETVLHEQHIAAFAQHRFNRLVLDLTGSVADYDYEDVSGAGDIGKEPIDVPGLRCDSSGFDVQTGLIFGLPGTLTGEIGIGWGEQQAIDDLLEPIEGLLLNADLIGMPTPMTKVEFLARSELSPTTLTDSLGAVDRFYELSLQHAFYRFLVLGAYVSYEIADYVEDPLVEERVREGVTAEYYFNEYFSVYGCYEHTDFTSTDVANEFTENEVRVGVRVRR